MCLRLSLIKFFDYICDNTLFNIVKICITPYDEINCEAPNSIAIDVANKVYECMVEAGKIFCTKCKLDADISWAHKLDENGKDILDEKGNPIILEGILPNYWIH